MIFFIYNANDANILQALNQTMPTRRPIKKHQYKHGDIDVENARFETREMSITGSHNWFNASCATTIAKLVGLSDDTIQKGLNSFENVPHRMEKVATINGITYINDRITISNQCRCGLLCLNGYDNASYLDSWRS